MTMGFPTQIKWTMPLMLLALSTGCATLEEKQCRTTDWREQGRSDGANGYESTRPGDHGEACSRYGIAPDPAAAYRAGRDEGLEQYCALDNAMRLGMNGNGYNQVCAGPNGEMFSQVYRRGLVLHAIRADMQELQSRLDSERNVQANVKDPDLYKQLEQNVRYFQREQNFAQRQYDLAARAVNAGFDPPFFEAGEWVSGIPYPKAARQVGKK